MNHEVADIAAQKELDKLGSHYRQRGAEIQQQIGRAVRRVEELKASPNLSINDLEEAWSEVDRLKDEQANLLSEMTGGYFAPEQHRAWLDRAEELGAERPRVGREMLAQLFCFEKVPVAPLREWIQARIAESHGEFENPLSEKSMLDRIEAATGLPSRHVRRILGIGLRSAKAGGKPSLTMFAEYDLIAAFGRAVGAQPKEIGI